MCKQVARRTGALARQIAEQRSLVEPTRRRTGTLRSCAFARPITEHDLASIVAQLAERLLPNTQPNPPEKTT